VSGADDLLRRAGALVPRVTPTQALADQRDRGAMLVDIRPQVLRARDGVIPGSVHVERNVLEWRLDPIGEWRLPTLRGADHPVVVVCNEGFASLLAAASVAEVGLRDVSDMLGGFVAWRAAGLPVGPAPDDEGALPGHITPPAAG
jgi:rhodanese-related sulfurtransferase